MINKVLLSFGLEQTLSIKFVLVTNPFRKCNVCRTKPSYAPISLHPTELHHEYPQTMLLGSKLQSLKSSPSKRRDLFRESLQAAKEVTIQKAIARSTGETNMTVAE
jgi:hypothetical protein